MASILRPQIRKRLLNNSYYLIICNQQICLQNHKSHHLIKKPRCENICVNFAWVNKPSSKMVTNKRTFIALLLLWALSQWALIDHQFSEQHNSDAACEWCTNHSSASEAAISSSPLSVTIEFKALSESIVFPAGYYDQSIRSRYAARAPPTA